MPTILWIAGSFIFVVLGAMHLAYTFFTTKFKPRDPAVNLAMMNTSPRLTKETTMWNAWIGFNGSHSTGAIFFGLVNIILALENFSLIQHSVSFIILNAVTLVFYNWLGRRYWFRIPNTGILIASCCFGAAIVLMLIEGKG